MTHGTRLDNVQIQAILPHRYPFLLVDRIEDLEVGKRVVGLKSVTINEPFFQGHFPGRPIMPGVLIIEAMAQVGAILAFKSAKPSKEGSHEVLFISWGSTRPSSENRWNRATNSVLWWTSCGRVIPTGRCEAKRTSKRPSYAKRSSWR